MPMAIVGQGIITLTPPQLTLRSELRPPTWDYRSPGRDCLRAQPCPNAIPVSSKRPITNVIEVCSGVTPYCRAHSSPNRDRAFRHPVCPGASGHRPVSSTIEKS